jgi:hypothetical protein
VSGYGNTQQDSRSEESYKNSARLIENALWFKAEILSIMPPDMTGVNVSVGNFPPPDQTQTAANEMNAATSGGSFSHHQHINRK